MRGHFSSAASLPAATQARIELISKTFWFQKVKGAERLDLDVKCASNRKTSHQASAAI